MAQTSLLEREPEGSTALSVQNEAASIMEVISRAASNPATDVDKLERLLGMYERVKATEAKAAYFTALSAMQDELPIIQERGEIKIGSGPGQKYALWEDINKAIKPILKDHGFALSFRTGLTDNKITVTGVLSHSAGHSEETTIHLPSDTSGSKNAVQAVGSSTSYGKRYTASALLNLTSSGDDDDGKSGGAGGAITEDQADHIYRLIKDARADTKAFCDHFKIAMVPDLPASKYTDAVTALNTKMRKASAK